TIYLTYLYSLALILFTSFFFHDPATPEIYTLSLHDALPISLGDMSVDDLLAAESRGVNAAVGIELEPESRVRGKVVKVHGDDVRSEEHTSELQSLAYLVCRLLLEKKKKKKKKENTNVRMKNQ